MIPLAALAFALTVALFIAAMETLFLTPGWPAWTLLVASYACAAAGGWLLGL